MMKKYNITIESVYALSMIILFSFVYLTIIVLTFTCLYDGYLSWIGSEQATEWGLVTGSMGILLLVGLLWALFPKEKEGIVLNRKDAPKLFDLVEKAVAKAEIHPINTLRLVPGSSIAVTGLINKELLIGVASLRHITEEDFEGILYHELGHFAAKDTKVGSFLGVYFETIQKQHVASVNFWRYSPHYALAFLALPSLIITWALLHLFSFMYAPYSKFREYKADEFAAKHCNSKQFSNALVNYAVYTRIHDFIMPQLIVRLLSEHKKLNNVYAAMTNYWTKENAEISLKEIMGEKEQFLDSHPSIQNRLKKLDVDKIGNNEGKKLKMLFKNFEKFEEQLSDDYTIRIGINAGLIDRSTKSLD
jgi:Zn-dependent protease with chaperone function